MNEITVAVIGMASALLVAMIETPDELSETIMEQEIV